MDDESGDDDRDELRNGRGGESRQEWWGWRNESGSWFQRRGDASDRALLRVNDYKCAKFQLPSSIRPTYWDYGAGPKIKNWELLISLDAPYSGQFFYNVAILATTAYQRTKFQLSSSISFRDIRGGGPKIKKVVAPDFPRRPLAEKIFIPGASTRKWLQVCQISTS